MAEANAYTLLLRKLSAARFAELLEPINRQSKERYFARHQVRAPKVVGTGFGRPGQKNQVRAERLHAVLQTRDDEPLAEEVVRLYLLRQRKMLAAALDHLKIPHEDGLTDAPELAQMAGLSAEQKEALVQHLAQQVGARPEDAELYLDFMAISAAA